VTFLRRLSLGLAALAGLALLVAVGAYVLLGTEWGAIRVLRWVESRSDGAIRFASAAGTLAGGVEVEDLVVQSAGARVGVDRTRFSIELGGLVARALVIDELVIGRVEYMAAAESGTTAGGSVQLPVLVLVRAISIDALMLDIDRSVIEVGETTLSLRAVDDEVRLERVVTHYDGVDLRGNLELMLDDSLGIDLDVCGDGIYEADPISVCARAQGRLPELEIDARIVQPYTAEIAGSVTLVDDIEFDLGVSWSDVMLFSEPELRSATGDVRLIGGLDSFRVSGDATVTYAGRTTDISLDAVTDLVTVRFDALTLQNDLGTLRGAGELELESLALTMDFEADGLNPAAALPDWSGDLDARGRLTARGFPQSEITLTDLFVSGVLREYPVTVTGGVSYAEDTWSVQALRIVSRSDRIDLDGTIGAVLALDVSADLADIGLVWPGLTGRAVGDARLGGTLEAPFAEGRVAIAELAVQGMTADNVIVEGSAGHRVDSPLDLDVRVEGFSGRGLEIEDGALTITGSVANHTATLTARTGEWSLETQAAGGFDGTDWRGRLRTFAIDPPVLEPWALAEPAELAVGLGGAIVSHSCLRRAAASICVEAVVAGNAGDRLRVEAIDFDIQTLAPFFPEGVSAAGSYGLTLDLRDPLGTPNGLLAVSGGETQFAFRFTEEETLQSTIDEVEFTAEIVDARLSLKGSVQSAQSGSADIDLAVEDYRNDASDLDGELQIEWRDTEILSLLSPEVGEVGGIFTASMLFGGSLDAPQLEGTAHWDRGFVEVPTWGFVVENITAEAASTNPSVLDFSATGSVRDSSLVLDGSIELNPDAGFPTVLRLRGERINVLDDPDAYVLVSPDLELNVRAPIVQVSGTIDVPQARLALVDLPEQAMEPSPDTVVHGIVEVEDIRPLEVRAAITLRLGDDVRYLGTNLDSRLEGALDLEYASGMPATARGTLEISGTYDAYRNPLDLERGRLVFAGPLDNPGLDVRATRRVEQVTVGVQMTGTLKAPETRIFSQPVMGEADALSYLLFGRPLERSENQDAEILRAAAVSMGLQQALPVIQRIGESLGFDEFTVRPTDTDAGALMAGKYLSPKLYVRYSYGLFNRIGGLLLRFRINDRLSIETRSGEQKSMDLLYTVEKN
jgi:translocation and assembly module TamB